MINQQEYEILKGLDDKWKWIARDGECNSLNVFSVKPIKVHSQWDYIDVGYKHARLTKEESKMLQFIQWEDEEPWNIQELIEGYESEETEMKKGKKGLVKYLEKEISNFKPEQMIYDYLTFILKQLNQLDEYEVLSPEWIDNHAKAVAYDGMPDETEIVYVDELQNLLVPKQEEVDQAYKDGYETGKQHTYYKGYLEGLVDKESINPERSPEVDQHKELLDELNDLYTRKNQDYGNSFDESLDEDGLLVLKIRLGDKYKRFGTLINQKNEVVDESMRDTLIDLANYALMGVMWMDKNEEEE